MATTAPHGPSLAYIFVVEDGKDKFVQETSLEDLFLSKQFTDNLQYQTADLQEYFHDKPNIKRYTRFHVRGTLKLMGCKSVESQKISDRVFRAFEKDYMAKHYPPPPSSSSSSSTTPTRHSPSSTSRRHSANLSRKTSNPSLSTTSPTPPPESAPVPPPSSSSRPAPSSSFRPAPSSSNTTPKAIFNSIINTILPSTNKSATKANTNANKQPPPTTTPSKEPTKESDPGPTAKENSLHVTFGALPPPPHPSSTTSAPSSSHHHHHYHHHRHHSDPTLPSLLPQLLSVTVKRSEFFTIMRYALHVQDYKTRAASDFPIACEVQDRKYSFTILLGGTSGCGKSTLAALLASRIGFSCVISTDNIRQLMRKFISRAEAPILWASTYHAGEILDGDATLTHKERILKGYEAQNEMIFKQLDALIGIYEEKKDSLIIEGVHLDTRLIMRLVRRHPTCIPFLMHISNEAKHRERFAIRSKYMTLDPRQNKYTKFFKNIRIINDYLCSGADEKKIPQIDNTNMDRSLATIHTTIFNCLQRNVLNGESYYNSELDNLLVVHEEYEAIRHSLWSSKGMLRVIREKRVQKGPEEEKAKEEGEGKEGETEEEEYEEEEEEGTDVSGREEDEAREPVISGQVGDPDFNSDDEDEEEQLPIKPKALEFSGAAPSATTEESDDGESSDEDGSVSDYFMDCGSLGS